MIVHHHFPIMHVRPLCGSVIITMEQIHGNRLISLGLELTPTEARAWADEVFKIAHQADSMNENQGGGIWDNWKKL